MQRPTCCGLALTQPPDLSLALIQLPLQLPLPSRHLPDEIQALALRPAGAGGNVAGRRKTWPRRRGMRQRRCRRTSRTACMRRDRLISPCALLPPPVNLPPRCLKSSGRIPSHLYQHNVLICEASEEEVKTFPTPSRQLIEHSGKLLTSRIRRHRSRRARHLLGPPCQPCRTFRRGHCSPWGQAIDYSSCH